MLVCVFRGLSSEMQVCRDMYIHMCAAKFIGPIGTPTVFSRKMYQGENNNQLSGFQN